LRYWLLLKQSIKLFTNNWTVASFIYSVKLSFKIISRFNYWYINCICVTLLQLGCTCMFFLNNDFNCSIMLKTKEKTLLQTSTSLFSENEVTFYICLVLRNHRMHIVWDGLRSCALKPQWFSKEWFWFKCLYVKLEHAQRLYS